RSIRSGVDAASVRRHLRFGQEETEMGDVPFAPSLRRARWVLFTVSALLCGLWVPACFYVLPPDVDATDRWIIAATFCTPLVVVWLLVSTYRRRTVLGARGAMGILALGTASILAVVTVTPLVPVVDERRYCQAHQFYARKSVRQILERQKAFSARAGRLGTLEELDIEWEPGLRERFQFKIDPLLDAGLFRVEARGVGYHEGCLIQAESDGSLQMDVDCNELCR
ncbi:MAG: hypothetical protein ACO3JL_21020, partial [Myxococcota bacterium]